MTEQNNNPVPPQPPAPPAPPVPPGELQAQLDRARSRNKALKITLALLATLLVLLGAAGYIVYSRIMQTKAAVEEAFQAFPQQAMFEQIQKAAEASAQRPGVHYSTSMPSSSLGLFSGGLPSGGQSAEAQQRAEVAMRAMNKYASRPIVKEFMADLKKNPDMAKAIAEGQGGNPIAMVVGIQNARGMEKIMAKYAMRPEFMQLLMEISRDPEVSAITKGVPGMPDLPAMPQQAPGGRAQAGPEDPDEPQVGEGMTLDPSAISGSQAPAPSQPRKRVPSPVDTE
ncbi:MAG: hypothetical protein ACYC2I_13915 [Elusimicrobiales bacterium]